MSQLLINNSKNVYHLRIMSLFAITHKRNHIISHRCDTCTNTISSKLTIFDASNIVKTNVGKCNDDIVPGCYFSNKVIPDDSFSYSLLHHFQQIPVIIIMNAVLFTLPWCAFKLNRQQLPYEP